MKNKIFNYSYDSLPSSMPHKEETFDSIILSPLISVVEMNELFGGKIEVMNLKEAKELGRILKKSVDDARKSFCNVEGKDELKSHPAYRSIIEKLVDLKNSDLKNFKISDVEFFADSYSLELSDILSDTGLDFINPYIIKQYYDEHIQGQDLAKRAFAITIYNHYIINGIIDKSINSGLLPKNNNLVVIGPTGTGKTLLIKLSTRLVDVPVSIINCAALVGAGYVGENLTSSFTNLYIKAKENLTKAEMGIVILDEFDKIAEKQQDKIGSIEVQQELLTLVEGCEINVPISHSKYSDKLVFNTSKICFIISGAFTGIDRISNPKKETKIGFTYNTKTIQPNPSCLESEHIIKYGIIPELVGRFNRITQLLPLDEIEVKAILTSSKNSALDKYVEYFKIHGSSLQFSDEALSYISKVVVEKGLGARYINVLIDKTLEEYLFSITSISGRNINITIDDIHRILFTNR